jgi:hypothetical protein
MFRTFAIEAMMLLLFSCTSNAQVSSNPSANKPSAEATARFTITFAKSPYADFLFYLLYRNTGHYPDLATAVAITDIPPLDSSSFLPEDSIISGVANYDVLYQLATHHDDAARLGDMLKRAEPTYPAFYSFWQQHVGPDEDKTASLWARQEVEWNPISHLEAMERLNFPFSSIQIDLLALDPQGSSMQGPPTIFTTLDVPSLAWAIGHEGTHMMVGPNGANWTARKGGDDAVRLMRAKGGSNYDVEEALCLLMQAKMSIASGATRKDLRTSDSLKPSPRKTLLIALENDWESYTKSQNINVADWLIAETLKTFGKR